MSPSRLCWARITINSPRRLLGKRSSGTRPWHAQTPWQLTSAPATCRTPFGPFVCLPTPTSYAKSTTAHVIANIRLFDELVRLGLGESASYQRARRLAWDWLMKYRMKKRPVGSLLRRHRD